MTVDELKAKLNAELIHLQQQLAQLRQQAQQTEVLLIKKQGALEALALLEKSDDTA